MRKMAKIGIVVVVAAALVAVGVFEFLTSTPPSNPCSSTSATLTGASGKVSPTVASGPAPLKAQGGSTADPGSGRTLRPAAAVLGPPPPAPIPVVAAENFWGSLVSQLGGNHTSVLSIVSDPNSDPHEYESNSSDATAISNAQLIIVNGAGYDNWALQLIAADGEPNQTVLNVGSLNGVMVGGGVVSGNPHMWYNPPYVNRTVAAMYTDLVALAPAWTSYFQHQYGLLNVSLAQLDHEADQITSHFAGTEVAATEDIFVYLANYTGLDLVSPPDFMEAIAEGNDPPAQSVVDFQCQLESGQVHVLVYNEQTVTPITTQMKAIAAAHNVSIVGVTETIQPPGEDFQTWMGSEYLELYNALNAQALGQ